MTVAERDKARRSAEELDRFVIGVIEQSEGPISAYLIAEISNQSNMPMVPAQVYRCIHRLLSTRSIEKIITTNTFVATQACDPIHFLCRDCGRYKAFEARNTYQRLSALCSAVGFKMREAHIELSGRCTQCQLDSKDVVI